MHREGELKDDLKNVIMKKMWVGKVKLKPDRWNATNSIFFLNEKRKVKTEGEKWENKKVMLHYKLLL